MTEKPNDCDRYPLHKAVFEGNLRKVSILLKDHDIGERDRHGKMKFKVDCQCYSFFCLSNRDSDHLVLLCFV